MQKIEYKESPSPHVIIENFLPEPSARECLAEAQWLEPVFIPAHVQGDTHSPEELEACEECREESTRYKLAIRSNDVIYLDGHYRGKRQKSIILGQLEHALNTSALLDAFKTFPHMFPIIAQTSHMETILSSYGMCDFYGWHTDTLPHKPSARIITCVVHFNTEPQQYEGGELILSGKTIEDQLAYKPVHNTAIFFESNTCVHAVDATKHEGEFKDSRFSINLWLGFDSREQDSDRVSSAHKYR